MKILTRLVYLLAILVFGFGVYLAFRPHGLNVPIEKAKITAIARPTVGPGSQSTNTVQSGPGDAVPAKRPVWLADPKHDEAAVRRFLATRRPDQKEMNAIANQIRVRIRFNELYDLLGLDKAEIARFEKAATEAGLIFSELVGASEAAVERHRDGQARSMDKVVTATLGEDYVPAFRAYLETSDLRLIAAELATNTFYSETPLTANQAEQFIRLSLDNRTSPVASLRINPDTIAWDAVLSRAGEFLTPAQLQSLQAMIAKRRFDSEFRNATGLTLRRPVRGL